MKKAILLVIMTIGASVMSITCKKEDYKKAKSGTFIDTRDDQIYKWVKIGDQVWMAENLKVTRYRNEDPIENVTDDKAWRVLKTGAYCNYNNDEDLVNTYGRLYNWYAVNDSRGICPIGWRVPSDEEWTILTNYLGGEYIAGGKLKEVGLLHWESPNAGATNQSKFSALPGGLRNPGSGRVDNPSSGGNFDYIGKYAHWYTSSEYDNSHIWRRYVTYDSTAIGKWDSYPKTSGFSVRCIKN